MKLAIFTSQEFFWENSSFSPLETVIWFHKKFQGAKKCRRTFSASHELVLAEVAALSSVSLNGEGSTVVWSWKRSGGGWPMRGGVESPDGATDVLPRASLGNGWGRGGTKLRVSKERHRTLGEVIIFFNVLPRIVWERVPFIYLLFYEGPLHSVLRHWPRVSGSGLLGVLNTWGLFAQPLAQHPL